MDIRTEDDAKEPLTDRQRAVLEFISQSIERRGYPPTLREIGEHMGIRSTNGVNDQEPWAFGPEVETISRASIAARYRLLPYLYSLFAQAATTVAP